MLKLSVITINFNNKEGLEKTVKSVVCQTFSNFEYIVIDGGSNDGSVEVLKQYQDKITYWASESDNGIYHAQNKGIEKAKGEYCLFLNSGDYLAGDDVIDSVFKNNESFELIACDLLFDYGRNKLIRKNQPDLLSFFYMMSTSLFHPSTFIKKSLFEKFGLYDEQLKIAADYDFFLKTTLVNKVSYNHMSIAVSAFDTSGISSNSNYLKKLEEERLSIQLKYFPDYIVKAAIDYNKLITSDSFKLFSLLKKNVVLNSIARLVFSILKKIKHLIKN
ncbi:MAG: glycosyltransferase family 2 protein [Bacteroidota bacterium]